MIKVISLVSSVVVFCQLAMAQPSQSKLIWQESIEKIKNRDFLGGAEKINEFLKILPHNPVALYNLGICKKNLGDLQGSCIDFKKSRLYGITKNEKFIYFTCNPEAKIQTLKKNYYPNTELLKENGFRPHYTRADTLRGALRLERTCYDVFFYNLTVRISIGSKTITGNNDIWFTGVAGSNTIQIDLFTNFTISRIIYGAAKLDFHREYNAVFIDMPEKIIPGKKYKISIEYSGKPNTAINPPWQGGFVWSHDKRLNPWVGVACEQLGASSWWPVKDHLSDRPDSMAINIEVPKKFDAISNGTLRKVVDMKDKYKRYEWFVKYPINNYNVSFYVGKYAEFTDTINCNNEILIARYHVLPFDKAKAKEHFKQARQVVSFYSSAFGPFPFPNDNFRMVESPYAGMEHQTAIAYGNAFSNKKNSEGNLNKNFDYIIVHEAAHEWWGNSIAATDMADVWLQEGFATYAEILFIEHVLGPNASNAEMHKKMKDILNIWPVVGNKNVNEDAFAGGDVYNKGATLLHCLRATINNDSLFMKMLYNYHIAFRGKVTCSADFIGFVNNYFERDFTPMFNKFLYSTELPILYYNYTHTKSGILLKYKWAGVDTGFTMPFSIKSEDGKTYKLLASTEEQELLIENARSFNFFSIYNSVEGCPNNGLTYFWTHCGSWE